MVLLMDRYEIKDKYAIFSLDFELGEQEGYKFDINEMGNKPLINYIQIKHIKYESNDDRSDDDYNNSSNESSTSTNDLLLLSAAMAI